MDSGLFFQGYVFFAFNGKPKGNHQLGVKIPRWMRALPPTPGVWSSEEMDASAEGQVSYGLFLGKNPLAQWVAPCCAPFFPFFLGKGSDSFKLNQPKTGAPSFFSHGHWASEKPPQQSSMHKVQRRDPLRWLSSSSLESAGQPAILRKPKGSQRQKAKESFGKPKGLEAGTRKPKGGNSKDDQWKLENTKEIQSARRAQGSYGEEETRRTQRQRTKKEACRGS